MFSFTQATKAGVTHTNDDIIKGNTQVEPLDIQYEKLNEWLLNRRFISENYALELKKIRSIIGQAMKEVENADKKENEENKSASHEGGKLMQMIDNHKKQFTLLAPSVNNSEEEYYQQFVDYIFSKDMRDLLEVIDKNTTTWYGGASHRLKLWRHIVKTYQNQYLYLADIATKLIRNVKYEIPALENSIKSCWKQLEDLEKSNQENSKIAADCRKKFEQQCKHFNIQGQDIEHEIRSLTKNLPSEYAKITKQIHDKRSKLSEAIQYYVDFLNFLQCNSNSSNQGICPLLSLFLQCADENQFVSVFDYKYKVGEVSADDSTIDEAKQLRNKTKEEMEQMEQNQIEQSKEVEIDWGNFDDTAPTEGGADAIAKEIEIDFGDDIDTNAKEIEIDFGEDGDTATRITNSEFGAASDHVQAQKIADMMGEHILSNDQLRYSVLNDLLELQAFFQQRIYEEKHASNNTVLSTTSTSVTSNEGVKLKKSIKELEILSQAVDGIVEYFTNDTFKELIMIKTSNRYVDRMIKSLNHTVHVANKLEAEIRESLLKKEQILERIKKILQPQIDILVMKSKEYKSFMETEISQKLLQGKRLVNIYGLRKLQ